MDKKNSDKMLKIICTVLLSAFLVISGIFIANKCVFSSVENSNPDSETVNSGILVEDDNVESENKITDIETTGVESSEKDVGKTDNENTYTEKTEVGAAELNDIDVEKSEDEKSDVEKTILDQSVNTETNNQGTVKKEILITPMENDQRIIPDKYNTGCKGDLVKLEGVSDIEGIAVYYNGEKLVFDFFYKNKEAFGEYIIENYDFTNNPVVFYHEDKVIGKKIKLVFKNCRFSTINTGRPISDVFSYEFVNCSFHEFGGSNAVFSRCSFGGSYRDGLVPFCNITVKDCYFSDFASNDPKGNGVHSDGTQIYGNAEAMVQNVHFTNCRFEIPAIQTTKSTAYVNACIMLQMEYNNADDIIIEDCIVNGGGYSIYAWSKFDKYKLSNIYFRNLKIGVAKLFGNVYYKTDDNVIFDNVSDQDSLYVSSIWNEGSKTHVIVTNDTGQERILRVVTGNGTKDFTIKPCLGGSELRYDNYDLAFEDFPFDLDITVEKSSDYIICFDVTDGCERQIRYVSFDGKPTYYIDTSDSAVNYASEEYIIMGSCGRDISYSLDKSGVLKLTGSGATYNYNSSKTAPWYDYSESVRTIEISEGITYIGAQAFRKLKKINSIDLPVSITEIGANAFIGCSGLKEISMHSGVKYIRKYAFGAVNLSRCIYYGSEEEWNRIVIESNNDTILSCEKTYIPKTS